MKIDEWENLQQAHERRKAKAPFKYHIASFGKIFCAHVLVMGPPAAVMCVVAGMPGEATRWLIGFGIALNNSISLHEALVSQGLLIDKKPWTILPKPLADKLATRIARSRAQPKPPAL